jgi:peptidoglycan-N-acetylglucosamine deacetylase
MPADRATQQSPVDTLGWQGTSGGRSVASVVERVRQGLRPGAIILMHIGANPNDGSTLDADALGQVITLIRAQGYRLRTLNALLPEAP